MALIIAAVVLSAAGLLLFSYSFPAWIEILYFLSIFLTSVSAAMFVFSAIRSRSKPKALRKTIISFVLSAGFFFGITFLVNNVIFHADKAEKATGILLYIWVAFLAVLLIISLVLSGSKKIRKFIALILSVVLWMSVIIVKPIVTSVQNHHEPSESPAGLGVYTEKEKVMVNNADFYVSVDGSDNNDGSSDRPFATIEKARDAVRQLDKEEKNGITVAVKKGEYRVSMLEFGSADSGTESCPVTYCAYGDGEVVLNGGVTIAPDSFSDITDPEVLNRLSDEAKDRVVVADLTKLGLTKDDWGKIYTIGSYNTADKYDGDYVGGQYCELFVNDKRMTIARYPNEGFLVTDKIVETGEGRESDGAKTFNENYENLRNPRSDTYKVSKKLADRINSWKTLDDVWMFGFFKYTWADASSPVGRFDYKTRQLSPKFVSVYGTSEDGTYYFFNVFEELDAPGEWYLDRENGLLYLYADTDLADATVDLSITSDNIIRVESDYLTFRDFTVKGTRGDAISITGSNNTVESCIIKNVGGNALIMTGSSNLAGGNEITHTGKGGISLSGGDTETLAAGNNKADNNLIHDWSEVFQTYQPAVTLSGVGNICSHNEIFNSPHEAIAFYGNNNLIEYNNIHDVCLLSDDAGAIYSGRRWDWYGNVIRYNAICNIFSEGHAANGIYLDDALSGQTVYGNILVNVGGDAFALGGGRDLVIRNNLIINCFNESFGYDDRARDGALNNGWFSHSSAEDGDMWTNLEASPWQGEIWQKAFPQYEHFSSDFSDPDNPDFAPNPAYSDVSCNIVINKNGEFGRIEDAVYQFSTVENNYVYKLSDADTLFKDYANGDYTINELPEGFEAIPINEIGRY